MKNPKKPIKTNINKINLHFGFAGYKLNSYLCTRNEVSGCHPYHARFTFNETTNPLVALREKE